MIMDPSKGGSIVFVLLSKVTILMKPLVNKSWYTELVLYLICLAMGTMLAAISFQLIPEGNVSVNLDKIRFPIAFP